MNLVLFINMGGALNLADCGLFLKNMFNDPYILPIKNPLLRRAVGWMITRSRVGAMRENYRALGGKSPLNEITARLCEKLNSAVVAPTPAPAPTPATPAKRPRGRPRKNPSPAAGGPGESPAGVGPGESPAGVGPGESPAGRLRGDFHFDFVNLYVPPFAPEVLARYELGETDRIILYPLYAHHSQTTFLTSLETVKKAIAQAGLACEIAEISPFYEDEKYNQMILSHILEAKAKFEAPAPQPPRRVRTLIFSAHSLPVSIIKKGDLYQRHTEAHVALLSEKLRGVFDEFLLGYQSRLGPVKWLGPNTNELLAGLKNEALIYPISFCIDCSETAYELELEYRHCAARDYGVVKCPNDSEEFVDFILWSLRGF